MEEEVFEEGAVGNGGEPFLERGGVEEGVGDPGRVGRRKGREVDEGEEGDSFGFGGGSGDAAQDGTFVEMGWFREAVDGSVVADEAIYFDSKPGFFQNFSYYSMLWGFGGIDAAAGKDPDRDVAPFDEKDRCAVGREDDACSAFWMVHEKDISEIGD